MNKFEHSESTTAFPDGNYTAKNNTQGFAIVGLNFEDKDNYLKRVEANTTFVYLGYTVSLSTHGLNHGGMLNSILVLNDKDEIVKNTTNVEDAILAITKKDFD